MRDVSRGEGKGMSWAGVAVAAWLIEPLLGSDLVRPTLEARASTL